MKTHVSKKDLSNGIFPSARPGHKPPTTLLKSKEKISRKEVLEKGRKKGQKVKSQIWDVEKMKKGIEEYEKAIDNGVRAADYQKEKGVSKSKIFSWRKAVKREKQSED